MALMHGKAAKMYWDAADTNTNLQHGQSWSMDISHSMSDVTSMQDTWRTYLYDFQDWTASVECLLDTLGTDIDYGGDDGLADDECQLKLYLTATLGLYGTAICNGISITNPADGIPTVSYSFQGVAQLQWFQPA